LILNGALIWLTLELGLAPEQDAKVLFWLVVARAFATLGRNILAFFVPLALGIGFPATILPGSAYASWVFLFAVFTAPNAANMVDYYPRLKLLNWSVFARNLSLILNGALIWLTLELGLAPELLNNTLGYFSEIPVILLFTCLLVVSSVNAFSSLILKISVEQEWVYAMYPVIGNPSIQRKFRLADHLTQIISPIVVSPIMYFARDHTWVVLGVIGLGVVTSIPEYIILRVVIQTRNELRTQSKGDSPWIPRDLFPGNPFKTIWSRWSRVRSQVLFLVIFANGFLSFWYLAHDATLFISYLTVEGVNILAIGLFRAVLAALTLTANVAGAWIISKWSVIHSMRLFLLAAAVLACISVVVVYFGWFAFLLDILFLHVAVVSYFIASDKLFVGLDVTIIHANESFQNIIFALMNILGCIIYFPNLFSIFVWINFVCVLGGSIAIFIWGSKKSNVSYVQLSSASAQQTEIIGDDIDIDISM